MFKIQTKLSEKNAELIKEKDILSKENDILTKEIGWLKEANQALTKRQEELFEEARYQRKRIKKLEDENERLIEGWEDKQDKIKEIPNPEKTNLTLKEEAVAKIFEKLYKVLPLDLQTYSIMNSILDEAKCHLNKLRIKLH